MRTRLLTAAIAALLCASVAPSRAASPFVAPPAGDISKNVTFVTNLPEMRTAISINFIGDTMFVSTVHGLYSYDISDPSAPAQLGALPMYIWENEDVDVDVARELVFISRDPRGFTSPATTAFPYGAVHVIDVSNPQAMQQISTYLLPTGHTTTCINACRYTWTGGPATGETQPEDWGGRPIFAYDITDPQDPQPCPEPIDLYRNDGQTDYAHDVQVDAAGVAWVSGAGGVRGYWTSGRHRNPLTGKFKKATGCKPIPYAGGGTPDSATPSRFMHNSWRNVDAAIPGDPKSRGRILYATEENTVSDCQSSGRFATYDLRGSLHGEGWKDIDKTKFRMKALDTWTPEGAEGASGCDSAHYFTDRGDSVLAYAFYSQGTRFLDASDPRNVEQIGYYRPDDANTWASYWHNGYVFVADLTRGVDILKFEGGTASRKVAAPVKVVDDALAFDRRTGFICQLSPLSISR